MIEHRAEGNGSHDLGPERLAELVGNVTEALRSVLERCRVTEAEWYGFLDFLTRVGRSDEFVLLSDTMGLSVLVDELSHAGSPPGATASNVLGPFWRTAAPIPNGGSLVRDDEPGERLVVTGTVRSLDGTPISAATIDVWQSNADGLYDVQVPGLTEPRWRGELTTGADGTYRFQTVVPPPYEVKRDGPVGALLERLGRHHFRPAHIHYKVGADGHQPLTTMMFLAGDPWLGDDTIGADKPSLIVGLDRSRTPTTAQFDIVLSPVTVERESPNSCGGSLTHRRV